MIVPHGHPWFVYAIILVYLVSPIMFYASKRTSTEKFLLGLVLLTGLGNLVVLGFKIQNPQLLEETIRIFSYRWMFLGQFLLFGFGMSLPNLIDKYGSKISDNLIKFSIIPLFTLMIAGIHFSYRPLFEYGAYPATGVFYIALAALTFLLVQKNYKNKVTSILQPVGQSSYALYLLHIPFFILLRQIGIIRENSILSIMAMIVLFPVLLKVSEKTEETLYKIVDY